MSKSLISCSQDSSHHAALPIDPQARKELHQLALKSKKYVYIMMDSGASINAGWAKKHFPGSVVGTSASQLKGEFANTANGDRLLQCHTSKSESKLTKCRLRKKVPVANTEQEFPPRERMVPKHCLRRLLQIGEVRHQAQRAEALSARRP